MKTTERNRNRGEIKMNNKFKVTLSVITFFVLAFTQILANPVPANSVFNQSVNVEKNNLTDKLLIFDGKGDDNRKK